MPLRCVTRALNKALTIKRMFKIYITHSVTTFKWTLIKHQDRHKLKLFLVAGFTSHVQKRTWIYWNSKLLLIVLNIAVRFHLTMQRTIIIVLIFLFNDLSQIQILSWPPSLSTAPTRCSGKRPVTLPHPHITRANESGQAYTSWPRSRNSTANVAHSWLFACHCLVNTSSSVIVMY